MQAGRKIAPAPETDKKKKTVKDILLMFDPSECVDGPVRVFAVRMTNWVNGNEDDERFIAFVDKFLTGARLDD